MPTCFILHELFVYEQILLVWSRKVVWVIVIKLVEEV